MSWDTVTIPNIRFMTGHETRDGVRMALKRAGVTAKGFTVGPGGNWPPKKSYPTDQVWSLFGERILDRAEEDAEVRAVVLEIFGLQIRSATTGNRAAKIFSDDL